jgi:hypothetical protein
LLVKKKDDSYSFFLIRGLLTPSGTTAPTPIAAAKGSE